MNVSLGEYQALVAKALRGVGYGWGMTEDGAFAIRWLAACRVPTTEIALRLLRYMDSAEPSAMTPNLDWVADGGALCSLSVGASISDRAGCGMLALGPTVEPVLIAPFLAWTIVSDSNLSYEMEWIIGGCRVTAEAVELWGELPTTAVPVAISRGSSERDQHTSAEPRTHRVDVTTKAMDELRRFAHRVYAPATDESRRGAGAGLIDDD